MDLRIAVIVIGGNPGTDANPLEFNDLHAMIKNGFNPLSPASRVS